MDVHGRPADGFEDRGADVRVRPPTSAHVRTPTAKVHVRSPSSADVRGLGCLLGCQRIANLTCRRSGHDGWRVVSFSNPTVLKPRHHLTLNRSRVASSWYGPIEPNKSRVDWQVLPPRRRLGHPCPRTWAGWRRALAQSSSLAGLYGSGG